MTHQERIKQREEKEVKLKAYRDRVSMRKAERLSEGLKEIIKQKDEEIQGLHSYIQKIHTNEN